MTISRNKFIETQARLLDNRLGFAPDERETRQRFEQLALATYDHLSAAGYTVLPFAPTSNLADDSRPYPQLPPSLHVRWKDWVSEYPALLERNPRLELHDMLHKIGESHMQQSWPYGFERRIQEWIDHGDLMDIPFIDGHGIVTAEFFDRLRTLRQRCDGWMYYDQKTNQIVFVSEPDWQKLCAAEDEQIARASRSTRTGTPKSEA